MLDESTIIKPIYCLLHKKEKATHICTDLHCQANPIMCSLCLSDYKYRLTHNSHENALKPVVEAADLISTLIRTQSKTIHNIYEQTLGKTDY